MNNTEQQFLKALDDKLWKAADKLRANLDAANYKHVVLGLIFLKYVSDAFEERQEALLELFKSDSDDNIYYLPREDFDSDEDYQQALQDELEVLDYYREANVFWVPKPARWNTLKEKAVLPIGTVLWQDDAGNDVKLRSVSWLIDNALEDIEKNNSKLKGILNRISQYQLDNDKLLGLINTFSDTSFTKPVLGGEKLSLQSKDILGHVYEYFLGQFALAEGKQGGQYYTPKSIVTLIVELLQPYSGRVYDPAMGSGGFFVSSDKFIEQHASEQHYDAADQKKHISVYGQESNPTTWKLAAMNMAIRGIDFNFGKKNADTFLDDQHPDLRADFVMANPPFNIKDWWSESLADDVRWKYGTPPKGNANFGWMQHMLHHLAPTGSMALLLANGSMSSNTNNEGEIRKRLVEEDLVECMVALPGQLFTNTQIPACIWFLTKDKANGVVRNEKKRDRREEFLFIDARNLGFMRDRVLRDFTNEDIGKITDTFHTWQGGESYENIAGFCKSASLAEIKKHDFVLTPGRYVGAQEQEEDDEPFAEKMARLSGQLREQFAESDRLEAEIKRSLGGWGMSSELSVSQDWNESQMQEFCVKVADGTHDSPKKTEQGKLLVTSKNIIGGTLDLTKSYRISEEDFNDVNRRSKVDINDVLLSMIGTVGEVCLIENEPDFAIKNVGLLKNHDPLKAKWLYFYLTSPLAQAQIKERLRGTTQQYLPLGEIRKFPIIYPESRTVMQEIVGVLAALQDKIQLNHQINQTLEQIAQAIFKSWFVDFEPVKAKIAALEAGGSEDDALLAAMQAISGKTSEDLTRLQTEQPEQYTELRATAELFPSAMQESELGELPEGWSVDQLSELIQFNPRRSLKKGALAPYLDMKNVPTSGHLAENVVLREMNSGTKFINGDTLLARITPCLENGKTAFVDFLESGQVGWGSTEYIVMKSKEPYPESISYVIARDTSFRQHAIQSMTGTSGRQRASAKALAELPWIIYPQALAEAFNRIASPYLRLARSHGNESKSLSAMRDSLLPKLLSGALKITTVGT